MSCRMECQVELLANNFLSVHLLECVAKLLRLMRNGRHRVSTMSLLLLPNGRTSVTDLTNGKIVEFLI